MRRSSARPCGQWRHCRPPEGLPRPSCWQIAASVCRSFSPYASEKDSASAGFYLIASTPGRGLWTCLLYTSDAADDLLCVDLGGRRIIKKKKKQKPET